MAPTLPRRRIGALPNLIVIGIGRCGTTSLHEYLARHPEIGMSRTKELNFFGDAPDLDSGPPLVDPLERAGIVRRRGNWGRGIDWYRSQFDTTAPVRGESSPFYTNPWFGDCAERIAQVVPDVKLILCVRDPIVRTISHYRHANAIGNDPRPVDAALSVTGFYALTSRYAERLDPFLENFPLERLLIVENEELESRRRETLRRIFRFLGVEERFWSPDYEQRWNVSRRQQGPGWRTVNRLRRLPGWQRVASLPPRKYMWPLERLSGSSKPRAMPEPSDAVRERLAASLAEDISRFRAITGRAFPSWSV